MIDTLAQNVCMLISLFLGALKSLSLRTEIFSYSETTPVLQQMIILVYKLLEKSQEGLIVCAVSRSRSAVITENLMLTSFSSCWVEHRRDEGETNGNFKENFSC